MTSERHPRKAPAKAAPRPAPKWVPWAALGLAVVVLVLLASVGPSRLVALLTTRPFKAQGALELTVLHTNDTWGLVFPCG